MIPRTSPYVDEVRAEVTVRVRRESLLLALEGRFPDSLPLDVANRVNAETDLEVLRRWLLLAATVATPEAFLAEMG
jgi:hypothetical protein